MPSTTSNLYLGLRRSMKYAFTKKYKIIAAEYIMVVSQLLQSVTFINEDNQTPKDEAHTILFDLNLWLYFIMTAMMALNIGSRLDDGALSEEEFAEERNQMHLNDLVIFRDNLAPNCDKLHVFNWIEISHNHYKITCMAFIVFADLLLTSVVRADDFIVKLSSLYFVYIAAKFVTTADHFDTRSLTSRAYEFRHHQNRTLRLFDNILPRLWRRVQNDDVERQEFALNHHIR